MKKKLLLVLTSVLTVFVLSVSGAQPGTDGDPIVTKSYIDGVVTPYVNKMSSFKVVDVPEKKSVILSAGSEVILRMGVCTVIGNSKGGLSDVTMGYDLPDATVIQGNHLVIAPLNDGRGVWTATSCKLMIKGEYTIK